MRDLFPDIPVIQWNEPMAEMDDSQWFEWVQHPLQALSLPGLGFERLANLERSLPADHQWAHAFSCVQRARTYRNQTVALSPTLAQQLYGEQLQGSVSRFEQFSSCAFAHFAQYGLRLRERETFELKAMDIGTLFHAVIERVIRRCQSEQTRISQLESNVLLNFAAQAVQDVVSEVQHAILTSSEEHRYTLEKLTRVVQQSLIAIAQHESYSEFEIHAMEWGFEYEWEGLQLRGRVDRLDLATDADGQKWIRIIDFKSSHKRLELDRLYYGLSLQLMTYLDIALATSDEWLGESAKGAGVFYFQVHDKLQPQEHPLNEDDREKMQRKKYRMSGLAINELPVLQLMDTQLKVPSSSSSVLSLRTVKDGNIHSVDQRSLLSQEQFQVVRDFVRYKLRQIGEAILGGDNAVQPYKLKQQMPCDYCSF
jgi:ATP-dependent helicase/nuclease subunit B